MRTITIISLFFIFFTFVNAQSPEMEINPPIIKAVIEPGTSVSNPINILNYGESESFSVSYLSKDNFIFIDESELKFSLDEGEGKSIDVALNGKFLGAGVYLGNILVSGKDNVIVPIILEVETFSPLFDVSIGVPESSLKITQGSDFVTEIAIYKLRGQNDNVILNYYISDTEGNIIISESQDVRVNKQLKLTKTFSIPVDIAMGDYAFYVTAKDISYSSTGTSSVLFSIPPGINLEPSVSRIGEDYFLIVGIVIIIVFMVLFLIFNHLWNNKLINEAKNWNEELINIEKMKFGDVARKINKLNYQRNILEKAYLKGYIKKKSYEDGKRRINEVINRLKKRL